MMPTDDKQNAREAGTTSTDNLAAPPAELADPGRRAFLAATGFTFAGTLLGCREAPVKEAIPYLTQPENSVPGRFYYYATTCGGCSSACGLLAKVRDGRPVKLEGNPQHPLSRGGLCAVGQASILGVYDSLRLQYPLAAGKETTWPEVDREVTERLDRIRNNQGAVRLLTGTVNSPSLRNAIDRFLATFPNARHVMFDPLSSAALADAHEATHGLRVTPHFDFARADVIASFDADFLGTWLSPPEFTRGYASRRIPTETERFLSHHTQIESRFSVTGGKADERIVAAPDAIPAALAQLVGRIAGRAGAAAPPGPVRLGGSTGERIDELAERLWEARGRSLVVCGLEDRRAQILCNYANHLLGNYGAAVRLDRPSKQRLASDREMERLAGEIEAGQVAALLIHGANPVFDLPDGEKLGKAIANVPLVVSLSPRPDETGALAHFSCPDHHELESWGDAEPVEGVYSLRQPALRPIGNTRGFLETLAAWSGAPSPAREVVRETWRTGIYPRRGGDESPFEHFWQRALHDGVVEVPPSGAPRPVFNTAAVAGAGVAAPAAEEGYALVLYQKVSMLDGRHAYNPWLQELPDPISKATWDNYASLSPQAAAELGVAEGDVVRIEADGQTLELPVLSQPGQHDRTVAVALGYGTAASERFSGIGPRWIHRLATLGKNGRVGVNAAPLAVFEDGLLKHTRAKVKLSATGEKRRLAVTQDHHTLRAPEHLEPPDGGERPIIQETTLAAFRRDPHAGALTHHLPDEDLWPPDHQYHGQRWGLAIDLNACTGCAGCVVACQVENNVPVVGKDEVCRKREMHWIRIDRYYSGAAGDVRVAHQPMMCQHCEYAPCETVCPVLATVHSEEGLNQQVYNRCVGTRYCANNCPYKVRRFNWFDYPREDGLANMVLNPDVTVRSRGVMEKCTFCVQRILYARLEAKREGRELEDEEVQTACQQSCPAEAIVFGDMNDPESRISRMLASPRTYKVLEEINVRPSVGYLRLVRNRPGHPGEEEQERHG